MKGTAFVLIALILGFIIACGCVTAPQSPAPVPATPAPMDARPHYVVGVDRDFPPFTAQDRGGNFSGFDVEAARWVADREGFDVTFVAVPWESIVPTLEAGNIDIIWSGLTITEKRKGLVNFSAPYYSVNQSIAIKAGSTATMQDLAEGKLKIGAQTGSTGADWVIANLVRTGKMPVANLILYPDITTLTENLENGTVDASIIQGPSQKQVTGGRSLVIIGTIPVQDTYAVAVRKNDPVLAARMNEGLVQLMNDPYWQQLKQKYGLEG